MRLGLTIHHYKVLRVFFSERFFLGGGGCQTTSHMQLGYKSNYFTIPILYMRLALHCPILMNVQEKAVINSTNN